MENTVYKKLKADALRYRADELQAFIDEAGWEEWMEEFTQPGGDVSERGLSEIEAIQTRAFNEAHEENKHGN